MEVVIYETLHLNDLQKSDLENFRSRYESLVVHLIRFIACWVKIATGVILKYCSDIFFQKRGFGISCKWSLKETICLEYQSLLSKKNKKRNVRSLASADFALRVVKVDKIYFVSLLTAIQRAAVHRAFAEILYLYVDGFTCVIIVPHLPFF